jgi:hypothetical protein
MPFHPRTLWSAWPLAMAFSGTGCDGGAGSPRPSTSAEAAIDSSVEAGQTLADSSSSESASLDVSASNAADTAPTEAAAVDATLEDATEGGPATVPQPPQTFALNVTAVDTTFATEDHFIASVEMQLSGEPLAQAMGRDLTGYVRNYVCQSSVCSPSLYYDPQAPPDPDGGAHSTLDLPGYSSAVESYEYSKQPMNNIAFESGAGTSLLFGPLLDSSGMTGVGALQQAQTWLGHMASASNATGRFVHAFDASNPLGWPGLWPVLQPFSSWDPSIQPTNAAGCSISSDDDPGARGALTCENYECDYSTLHLPNRAAQVTPTIGPGPSGWVDWKEALWTLNYMQVMHDVKEVPIPTVPTRQLSEVGIPGNAVVGALHPGVYLGSSDIEGFQAGNFVQILDNQAAQWLLRLTTTDGSTLTGFASIGDALAYSPSDPLRWFPSSIRVSEVSDGSGFPNPSGYSIAASGSDLLDQAGLLGAYATVYSLTDHGNPNEGGSQPVQAYFDGDPFPQQNQTPDGESTLHDRSLAMIRVLVVNIDRMHVDPAAGIPVDHAEVGAAGVTRGNTLSAEVAAYALLALRTTRRSLDSELALYTNTKPDSHGIPSPLDDGFPMVDGVTFGERLDALIGAVANVFYDHLSADDGRAFASWNVATGVATDQGTLLDAHTAAVRGLLTAYLATGATKFRDRALAVFHRIENAFYDPDARVYRATADDRSTTVTFTPRRFGLLQASLRDTYELIATLPGNDLLASLIADRVARLNKLVLNGWDDRDEDQLIEWPSECARLGTGPDGKPLGRGGLQMAERVLTGESGSANSMFDAATRVVTTDREHDCVPEVSAVGLPSALANSVTFTLTPWSPSQEGQLLRDGGWVDP